MADRKITDLTALAAGSQATGDLLTIVDVSEAAATDKNKKITVESLFKGIPSDVGINVTSPTRKFQVAGGGTSIISNIARTDGTSCLLTFSDNTTSSDAHVGIGAFGNNMLLRSGNAERMRIDSSGRVGIGTSSPSDVLTVAGTNAFIKVDRSNGNPGIDFRYNGSTTNRGLIDVTSAGALRIAAGGNTERMRIDSSGNVGINKSSPSYKLEVDGGSSTAARFTVDDSSSGIPGLITTNGANADLEHIIYTSKASIGSSVNIPIAFHTNGKTNERVRIQTGGGISFNGDTAAANALDDYEDGSWTPVFSSGITSPTYTTTFGGYTKIGRLVTFTLRMDAGGTTNSDHAQIGGLPFTSTSANIQGGATFNYAGNIVGNGDGVPTLHVNGSNTILSFYFNSGGTFRGNSGNGVLGVLHIHGFYYTD